SYLRNIFDRVDSFAGRRLDPGIGVPDVVRLLWVGRNGPLGCLQSQGVVSVRLSIQRELLLLLLRHHVIAGRFSVAGPHASLLLSNSISRISLTSVAANSARRSSVGSSGNTSR